MAYIQFAITFIGLKHTGDKQLKKNQYNTSVYITVVHVGTRS